jgi:hypothetical protein
MALRSDPSIVLPPPWLDIWAVNVIWCLARTTKDNGATLYVPGTNKWTTWEDVPDNAPDLLVPFEAHAGDTVVIDGRAPPTESTDMNVSQLYVEETCARFQKPFRRLFCLVNTSEQITFTSVNLSVVW